MREDRGRENQRYLGWEMRSVSFYTSEGDHVSESGGSKELPVCFQFLLLSLSSALLCLVKKVEEVLEEEKKVVASVETRRVAYSYGGSGIYLAIASADVYGPKKI